MRAAILRLDHEGLVVRERNRGARVRRFTPAEAVEILEARAALESLAAGYAALRRNDDDIRVLRGLVADMARMLDHGELLSISERNAVLHRRILEISDHRVARDICSRLHSQMVRYQFRTVLAPGRPPRSLRSTPGSCPRSPPATAAALSGRCTTISRTWRSRSAMSLRRARLCER